MDLKGLRVMQFSDFEALSFDCYGTLIDWETGIWNALQPIVVRSQLSVKREEALVAFAELESAAQASRPTQFYPHLLTSILPHIAERFDVVASKEDAAAFGASVGLWPAFPDAASALRRLGERYKLIILSNVDVASFCQSAKRLEAPFDYVFTAQEIRSYKPNPANFDFMESRLEEVGITKTKTLHVAQSLFHDHQEATRQGYATCWIDRRQGSGWGATKEIDNMPKTDWAFPSMSSFADAVENE
jgi:2-haloacid dehalogenase